MQTSLWLPIAAVILLPLFYFLFEKLQRKRLRRKLQAKWGTETALRRLDADQLADIALYHEAVCRFRGDEMGVDATTWRDLDMDAVFLALDASESIQGSEALYSLLHDTGVSEEALKARDALAEAFVESETLRLDAQEVFSGIGRAAFHGTWRYLFSTHFQFPKWGFVFPVLALMPAALALFGILNNRLLLAAALAFVVNAVVYYRTQATWQKELAAIRHIGAVLRAAQRIARLRHPALNTKSAHVKEQVGRLRAIRFWLPMFGMEAFGDMAIVLEYLKIMFMLDMVSLFGIVREINRKGDTVRELYAMVGETEACLSIAQWQARGARLCKPVFHQEPALKALGLRHPLLKEAVPNDLNWRRNLLISGSNASGKSTFIKAVGVNAVLAQTLYRCAAENFSLKRGRVMSAMAVRDNLLSGESYFIVEIKSLKRILDAVKEGRVYCLIDEILRGTNTIERIAASAAVLSSLVGEEALCMAATHDIELTRMLAAQYENHHFSEQVTSEGIHFDYQIKPGPTQTRNAIRLLSQMGYADEVIKKAEENARRFETDGRWPDQ